MDERPTIAYTWFLSRLSGLLEPFFRSLRDTAVAHLELAEGDRALDVGCGTGPSFPHLRRAVGNSGEVVGVELNPDMARRARERVAREQMVNVQVIEDAAQTALLSGQFDGLLLFAAHEVLTSPEALDHLVASLKGNARVVAYGAKRTGHGLGKLLGSVFGLLSRLFLPPSTPPIDDRPWRLLEERTETLHVQERARGAMYLVWGTLKSAS